MDHHTQTSSWLTDIPQHENSRKMFWKEDSGEETIYKNSMLKHVA